MPRNDLIRYRITMALTNLQSVEAVVRDRWQDIIKDYKEESDDEEGKFIFLEIEIETNNHPQPHIDLLAPALKRAGNPPRGYTWEQMDSTEGWGHF